jgi:hypothetical protein
MLMNQLPVEVDDEIEGRLVPLAQLCLRISAIGLYRRA